MKKPTFFNIRNRRSLTLEKNKVFKYANIIFRNLIAHSFHTFKKECKDLRRYLAIMVIMYKVTSYLEEYLLLK